MPRTGGDYVFNSRSLHPSIGFAAQLQLLLLAGVIYGVYTTYLAAYGFGAFGRMMAGFTGSSAWLDFGDWFSKDYALFITGTVAAAALGRGVHRRRPAPLPAPAGRRVRALRRWARSCCRSSSGSSRAAPASSRTSTTTRPTSARPTRPPRSRRRPRRPGFAPTGFDTEATLKSVTVFWYIFGFLYSSNYFAGEIRLRKRTHLRLDPRRARRVGRGASRCSCSAYLQRHGLQLQRPARLRRSRRVRLRRRRARVPRDHGHRLRHLGARRDHHHRLRGRAADLAAADDAAGQPQHVRLVVRPDHARSSSRYVDPRTPLAARRDRDRDAAGDRQHGDLRVHRLVQHALGAARAVADAARHRGRRHRAARSASGRWSRTRRTAAQVLGIPMVSLVGGLALLGFGLGVGRHPVGSGLGRQPSGEPRQARGSRSASTSWPSSIYFVSRAVRKRQGIDLSLDVPRAAAGVSRLGLVRRKLGGARATRLRLYYASDIHGTEVLWRKFLHAPEVYERAGDRHGRRRDRQGRDPAGRGRRRGGDRGAVRAPERAGTVEERRRARAPDPLQRHVPAPDDAATRSARRRPDRGGARGVVRRGDAAHVPALDGAGRRAARRHRRALLRDAGQRRPAGRRRRRSRRRPGVEACDERIVDLGPATRWSRSATRTSRRSTRRASSRRTSCTGASSAMAEQVEDLSRCVFNLHVPPYASHLDTAPELDENLRSCWRRASRRWRRAARPRCAS